MSGACNFFKGDKTFRLNGEPWEVPKKGFYTTVANVDFALEFLTEARGTEKPWYLYIAFNAPHAPLHALPQDYEKYKGRYDEGWDVIRNRRVEKQKEIGLLHPGLQPSPRPEHVPAWQDMESWRQKYEANRMTTLAAMIDRVDQEVGRLVQDLKKHGELDNTMLLFVSDNGACPYDRKRPLLDVEPTNGDVSLADSTGWSWARNSPFRYYKQNQFEGGISTPGIIHWPDGLKTDPGSIVDAPAHLIDVLPTLSAITGSEVPSEWKGRKLRPVSGVSLVPVFRGDELRRDEPLHFLFSKDRALRDGDWKAVSFRGETWELYNIKNDRTEIHDLAEQEPLRLKELVQQWNEIAREVLHAKPAVYSPVRVAKLPHQHPEWTKFGVEPEAKRRRAVRKRPAIRARKDTTLRVNKKQLVLDCRGSDSGIAIDRIPFPTPVNGPYLLSFRAKSAASGSGEVFFTTNARQTLPKGEHLVMDVIHDDEWHDYEFRLRTDRTIHALRIDPCSAPGMVWIEALELKDSFGNVLVRWPAEAEPTSD